MTGISIIKKKLISFVVIAIILIIAVNLVAGCNNNNTSANDGETNSPADLPNIDNGETAAEPIKYAADYLPDKTYGGYEFRMVAPSGYEDLAFYADVEEETGFCKEPMMRHLNLIDLYEYKNKN